MIGSGFAWHNPALLALTSILGTTSALGQQTESPDGETPVDYWGPLRMLEGRWEGEIDGALGTGKGVRRYEFLMNGKFLISRHNSVRLPQAASPEGDQHGELGVFSYDSERETLVLREFMGEGVVIRSTCAIDGSKVVCTSESVESGPGIKARLTLQIRDRYRFTEQYEMAWTVEDDLKPYFNNLWTRVPDFVD